MSPKPKERRWYGIFSDINALNETGQLWAENNKTGGVTFNVTLPLSHAGLTKT
jgi:hypothetical protein